MYHYIALAWPSYDPRARIEAAGIGDQLIGSGEGPWRNSLSTQGLSVYCRPPVDPALHAYVLPDELGVIVGRLFSSGPEPHPLPDTGLPGAEIVASGGRWLRDNCWGPYIAFLRAKDASGACVLRDCTGQIPCFHLQIRGVHVFFADVTDVQSLRIPLTINERYLAAFIAQQPLHLRETGLNEITELLAGDCVTVSPAGEHPHPFWNPQDLVAAPLKGNYQALAQQLVTVTEGVLAAWASLSNRILLSLSGGLDSAIILGCLARLGFADRVVCVTQYTSDTPDDERIYAREAARMTGARHIEIPRICDGNAFVENLGRLPADPRPDISKTARILSLGAMTEIAETFGCDTRWTGQGGDQVFLQTRHPYGAADYLMQCPLPWHIAGQIYRTAILSRHSVWSVTGRALTHLLRRDLLPRAPLGGHGHRFLGTSAHRGNFPESPTAPWRGICRRRLPPGKVLQLDTYLDLLNRHKPIVGLEHPYERHPFISQPLLEFSLSVPTYFLLHGGRQRGMAREAFADRVPASILCREDKGEVADQVRTLLRTSGPLIAESLLDGALASMGIISRHPLEEIVLAEDTFSPSETLPLLACIAAEAWLRHWSPRSNSFATPPPIPVEHSLTASSGSA
jgi:asparagine synthase (glutamine-hydrolysing)